MNRYTHTLTLALPYTPELADIASRIGRALDPDNGGADSWVHINDSLECRTPCTEEFYNLVRQLVNDVEALYSTIVLDYTSRWANLTPPSQAEVELFINELVIKD